jgi:hypothetical protein
MRTLEGNMVMNFVDRALEHRLESAEEMLQVHHARVYEKNNPQVGSVVVFKFPYLSASLC